MTPNFWLGVYLLRARITDAQYHTKFMQCQGSNRGLCACQASTLPPATFYSPERLIFAGGGFEILRVMHVPPAPTLLLSPPCCSGSATMYLPRGDNALSEKTVVSQWNRQPSVVALLTCQIHDSAESCVHTFYRTMSPLCLRWEKSHC